MHIPIPLPVADVFHERGHGIAKGQRHAEIAMVARISVKIIFEEFLQRYPDFNRMQQQLPWMPSTTFRSPMRLDLAVN